jgi:hypothetical protein
MNSASHCKRTALALHVVALLAVAGPADVCAAATWTVNTCAENNVGTGLIGSLRYAVANAADGDTVDMAGLTCGTISLESGAIVATQPHLYLKGPGKDSLTISGALEHDRILRQILPPTYFGGLYISDLSISGGDLYSYANAAGGCIYSYTRLRLTNVNVSDCHLKTPTLALGAGVFAKQSFTMTSSSITSTEAVATGNDFYYGGVLGGAISARGATINSSTISGNTVLATHAQGDALGAGLFAEGGAGNNVSITGSTISGNVAKGTNGAGAFGAAAVINYAIGQTTITDSTITNNYASNIIGGILVASPNITVRNSTITDNAAAATAPPGSKVIWASGFATYSALTPMGIKLQSTIIANNRQGGATPYASDFGAVENNGKAITIAGSNNLVGKPLDQSVALPADTLVGTCPLLGPLRDNGGTTQTRALLSHSPAIDSGNNLEDLDFDQRGFARVSGVSADIGAYELDPSEVIFNSSFEGCL